MGMTTTTAAMATAKVMMMMALRTNTRPHACVAGNGMKNNSIIFHEQFAKICHSFTRRLIGDGDADNDGDVGRALRAFSAINKAKANALRRRLR